MNTDISLVAELELTDVELEAVVGGRGALIGSITIVNDSPIWYVNSGTNNYTPSGYTKVNGDVYSHGSSTGIVSNAGGSNAYGNASNYTWN